jgi:hypothetical protein
MLRKSFVKFIQTNITELTKVIIPDAEFIISGTQKPFATVSQISHNSLNTMLGDQGREQIVSFQIGLYCNTLDEQIILKEKLQRTLEKATVQLTTFTNAMDGAIPLLGLFEKLRTANNKDYYTDQPMDSVQSVYKNNTLVYSGSYSINLSGGQINFLNSNLASDIIRADYTAGFLQFSINKINDAPLTGVDNVTHKFNSFFTLLSNVYIKDKANKLF